MNPAERGSGKQSVRKLLAVLVVLVMVLVGVALYVLLSPSAQTPAEGVGINLLVSSDIRDPQIATQYGILGYIELTWAEPPPQFLFSRGETWTATMLARFVSYDPETTEADLRFDPEVGIQYGKGYTTEWGTKHLFMFSSLFSYEPNGTVTLKPGETMQIKVTVQIPASFPDEFTSFNFSPLGIESANRHIPLLAEAVQPGEVPVT